MVTSFKRTYVTCCVTQASWTQSPWPCSRPLLTYTSTGDTQTLKDRSDSVSVGSLDPGAHKVLFSPSEYLWQVWGLILNAIFSLLLLAGTSLLLLDMGYLFWWDPTFSCQWLFSSKLSFWRPRRRRWVHILLLLHLVQVIWLLARDIINRSSPCSPSPYSYQNIFLKL